jgi:Family of unknown function (DUF6232)
MAEEAVFLSEGNVYVSNTRVVLAGTTYATANLTSVSKRFTPASKGCAMLLVALGALLTLGSFGAIGKDPGSGFVMLIVCAGILAAEIAWLRSLKPTYHVVLASASGEVQGLSSKDGALVDRVINAITRAITHRG